MFNQKNFFFKAFIFLFLLVAIRYLLFTHEVLAICPVCTVAVGAGLEISRLLGVDDSITSVWIGGLILSIAFWFIDWLGKRYPKTQTSGYKLLTIVIIYILVLVPLIWSKSIGLPYNKIFGVDKIIFGTFIGSLVFLFAWWSDQKVRKLKGKQTFNYQKVIFPVVSLAIASLILYFITK
jgi:hypothetical protein